MLKKEKEKSALILFKKRKVMTIPMLMNLLDCSTPTIRKRLRKWNVHTSYNKNGRYYALPEVVKFDKDGFWRYKQIFFSQYGNLKNTVIQIINASQAGLESTEIGKLTGLSPRSFMSHFQNIPEINREKCQGKYLYLSNDKSVLQRQKKTREEVLKKNYLPEGYNTDAVFVLVDRLKHPGSTLEQCTRRLRNQGRHVNVDMTYNLLLHFGLLKKTADLK